MINTIYLYSAKSIKGEIVPFTRYKEKVVLIVNTASNCGFTWHYKGLQELYEKYNNNGFEVLGFPCNQFAGQEPGNSDQISNFCKTNFGVTFPLFEKVDVNGENAHPLYRFLTNAIPGTLGIKMIKWNFTKFLIDKDGRPVKRFSPTTAPDKIETDIRQLLGL